jgi:hypothetical protein
MTRFIRFAGQDRREAMRRRNLLAGVEQFESRCVLDASPWCNVTLPADANVDGSVTQADADLVSSEIAGSGVGYINVQGSGSGSSAGSSPGGLPDATNDWVVNQADVDFINSAIAQASGSGSGSSSGGGSGSGTASGSGSGTASGSGSGTGSGSGSGTGSSTGTSSGSGYFTIDPAQADEGQPLVFKVTFHGTAVGPSVTVATQFYDGPIGPAGWYANSGSSGGGSGIGDYGPGSTTMTFTGVNGESHDFIVNTVNDNTVEWTELMQAKITAVSSQNGATLSGVGNKATGMIFDNDTATATISAPSGTNWEGNSVTPGSVAVPVTFSAPVEKPGLTFSYNTVDGAAKAATDYNALSGTYATPQTFQEQAGFWINVTFKGDFTVETTLEDFDVDIGGGGNGVTLATTSATINITDEDTASINLVSWGLSATEGGSMTATVWFVGNSDVGGGTVDFTTNGGTAFADDGLGGDYTTPPSPTHIHVNGTNGSTGTVTFYTKDDNTVEAATEWFTVLIANLQLDDPSIGGRIAIGTASATATITDNDAATLSISDATTWEEDWMGASVEQQFYVTLSKPVDVPISVTVTLGTGGSNATGFAFGADVFAAAGTTFTLTFNPGQTSQSFSVWTRPDTISEGGGFGGRESYLATITAWSYPAPGSRNVTLTDWVGEGTIISNDP